MALLDLFRKADPPVKPTQEVGVSGVRISSGYVHEEFLTELRGDQGRRKFREMADNDAIIGAILYAVDMLLRSAEWNVDASDRATPEDAEQAVQFVESIMDDMSHPWEDTVSEILTMLVFGWSYLEIVMKRRMGPEQRDPSRRSAYSDGRYGIRKLAPRSQLTLDRWEMDDDGGVKGLWQIPPNGGQPVFIPIEKALLFRTRSAGGNPEGRSLLRNAYKSYHFLKNIQMVEAIGIERELAGLPVVRIPSDVITGAANGNAAAAQQLAAYKQIARDVKFNEQGALILPSDPWRDPATGTPTSHRMVDIELMASSGTRAIDTGKVIRRYQQDIAMTVLADFILLGLGDKGSFALSENKTDMFTHSLQGFLGDIAAVFNRFLLPRIWQVNGLPHDTMPTLRPGTIAPVDLGELGEFVQRLAGAGAPLFPDDDLEAHLREKAGLPERSSGE